MVNFVVFFLLHGQYNHHCGAIRKYLIYNCHNICYLISLLLIFDVRNHNCTVTSLYTKEICLAVVLFTVDYNIHFYMRRKEDICLFHAESRFPTNTGNYRLPIRQIMASYLLNLTLCNWLFSFRNCIPPK